MDRIGKLLEMGIPEDLCHRIDFYMYINSVHERLKKRSIKTKQSDIDKILNAQDTINFSADVNSSQWLIDFDNKGNTYMISKNDCRTYEITKYITSNPPIPGVLIQPKSLEEKMAISQVKFIVNGDTVTIDDPDIIEKLRDCLKSVKVGYPNPSHRPKDVQKTIMRALGFEVMEVINFDTEYKKHQFIKDIFSIYNKSITIDTIKKWY